MDGRADAPARFDDGLFQMSEGVGVVECKETDGALTLANQYRER